MMVCCVEVNPNDPTEWMTNWTEDPENIWIEVRPSRQGNTVRQGSGGEQGSNEDSASEEHSAEPHLNFTTHSVDHPQHNTVGTNSSAGSGLIFDSTTNNFSSCNCATEGL